ncbi:MAG: hypothetical protein FJ304_08125 [Planctomycetes bacterium]|nr:hypothetical protein [Planctomycetota bacterium]
MTRWFTKRWVWAALAGAGVTLSLAATRGEEPPKAGTTITLPIDGKAERQFKVLKTEKQLDGTYLSELKDVKTGETLSFLTRPGDDAPKGAKGTKGAPNTTDTGPPKARPRTSDPLTPPPTAMPDPMKDKGGDKRPILGRIFGDKDKTPAPSTSNAPPATDAKKPGLLGRVFGPKKPSGPGMPAATSTGPTAGPVVKPSPSNPPPIIPFPSGGFSGTGEPPRVMPPTAPKPVAPPQALPSIPAVPPVAAPSAPAFPAPSAPAFPSVPSVPSVPAPLPLPAVPSAPSVPAPPAGTGLPPIPVPPGGTSATKPLQVVVPAGYVPAQVAFDRDVQPFVIALQTMQAPSARLTAAKALADGRHRSTDGVKGVLFQAAQLDPCGEVRAACLTHLCDLGYFTPQFLGFIEAACNDTDPMVRDAAKSACAKMIRK